MKRRVLLIIGSLLFLALLLAGLYLYRDEQIKRAIPSLNLNGEKKIVLNLQEKYQELGAKAYLNNKDISQNIKIVGQVDNAVVGSYEIKYFVTNKKGFNRQEVIRTVIIMDTQNPVIILMGKDDATIYLNQTYKEAGFTATDNYDGDITGKVKIINEVDNTKEGKYHIIYKVKDSSGNETAVERKITVKRKVIDTGIKSTNYVETNTSGIAILMYHFFYDATKTTETYDSNYMEISAFESQLKYLKENDFYFPTWDELSGYIDRTITLPKKSVIITIDDGAASFFELALPLLEKYQIKATSFLITSRISSVPSSEYVIFESHTHAMHQGGCSGGGGGLFRCISVEKGLNDLKTSIDILGKSDVLAYPFGDTNSSTYEITKTAGFKLAVTTKYGKVKPNVDKLLLPRIRMFNGISLSSFAKKL